MKQHFTRCLKFESLLLRHKKTALFVMNRADFSFLLRILLLKSFCVVPAGLSLPLNLPQTEFLPLQMLKSGGAFSCLFCFQIVIVALHSGGGVLLHLIAGVSVDIQRE